MGVSNSAPRLPVLVMVKVPPERSSAVTVPLRTFSAALAISAARAELTTGLSANASTAAATKNGRYDSLCPVRLRNASLFSRRTRATEDTLASTTVVN